MFNAKDLFRDRVYFDGEGSDFVIDMRSDTIYCVEQFVDPNERPSWATKVRLSSSELTGEFKIDISDGSKMIIRGTRDDTMWPDKTLVVKDNNHRASITAGVMQSYHTHIDSTLNFGVKYITWFNGDKLQIVFTECNGKFIDLIRHCINDGSEIIINQEPTFTVPIYNRNKGIDVYLKDAHLMKGADYFKICHTRHMEKEFEGSILKMNDSRFELPTTFFGMVLVNKDQDMCDFYNMIHTDMGIILTEKIQNPFSEEGLKELQKTRPEIQKYRTDLFTTYYGTVLEDIIFTSKLNITDTTAGVKLKMCGLYGNQIKCEERYVDIFDYNINKVRILEDMAFSIDMKSIGFDKVDIESLVTQCEE